jgi:hypothetical protein
MQAAVSNHRRTAGKKNIENVKFIGFEESESVVLHLALSAARYSTMMTSTLVIAHRSQLLSSEFGSCCSKIQQNNNINISNCA